MTIALTPHQQEALDWLVAQVQAGVPLVALRGLAGTGKTTLIPALCAALDALDIPADVGAPTHRATMVLRSKGLPDAKTVHSHALIPYFTADYARAMAWLGEAVPTTATPPAHVDVDGLPWLVAEQRPLYREAVADLIRDPGRDDEPDAYAPDTRPMRRRAARLLSSIGIHGKNHFHGFGPKASHGVLIIDEASMVGQELLAICQDAYPQIVLIGDPGQLPPVKDLPMLAEVPGRELTEMHRQAAASPILQLAYRARQGAPVWREALHALQGTHLAISKPLSANPALFLDAPLIVWRNATRREATTRIRTALGYPADGLVVGEPLICRSTDGEHRAEGFYNNGLYRVVEVSPVDRRTVTVRDDLANESTIVVHLEELDGERIPYQAIPFRFAYCLTAHTAQGGEWPLVYISLPDFVQYAGFCSKTDRLADIARWGYTAITRAKDTLCFLAHHTFTGATTMPPTDPTPIAPPSAPMLTHAPEPSGEPTLPIDDILDPPVPRDALPPPDLTEAPGVWREHEALLHGFATAVQGRLTAWMREQSIATQQAETTLADYFQEWAKMVTAGHAQATGQLALALASLREQGLGMLGAPYSTTVQAQSPEGYRVTIEVKQRESGELVTELEQLLPWLQTHGYTAVPEGRYA